MIARSDGAIVPPKWSEPRIVSFTFFLSLRWVCCESEGFGVGRFGFSCSGCCYNCYVGIVSMFVLGDVPVDVLNPVLISIAVVVPICFFGVVRF